MFYTYNVTLLPVCSHNSHLFLIRHRCFYVPKNTIYSSLTENSIYLDSISVQYNEVLCLSVCFSRYLYFWCYFWPYVKLWPVSPDANPCPLSFHNEDRCCRCTPYFHKSEGHNDDGDDKTVVYDWKLKVDVESNILMGKYAAELKNFKNLLFANKKEEDV